jgi:hypothetical protein
MKRSQSNVVLASVLSAVVYCGAIADPAGAAEGVQLEKVTFAGKLSEKMEAIKPGSQFAPDAPI